MITNVQSKTLSGFYDSHLTNSQKKVIEHIIKNNMIDLLCKSGRIQYYVSIVDGKYSVIISKMERRNIGENPKMYADYFWFDWKESK
jgi:hypothetical protein